MGRTATSGYERVGAGGKTVHWVAAEVGLQAPEAVTWGENTKTGFVSRRRNSESDLLLWLS